jgi:hypothetical protein
MVESGEVPPHPARPAAEKGGGQTARGNFKKEVA